MGAASLTSLAMAFPIIASMVDGPIRKPRPASVRSAMDERPAGRRVGASGDGRNRTGTTENSPGEWAYRQAYRPTSQ